MVSKSVLLTTRPGAHECPKVIHGLLSLLSPTNLRKEANLEVRENN